MSHEKAEVSRSAYYLAARITVDVTYALEQLRRFDDCQRAIDALERVEQVLDDINADAPVDDIIDEVLSEGNDPTTVMRVDEIDVCTQRDLLAGCLRAIVAYVESDLPLYKTSPLVENAKSRLGGSW